jgi:hypothetical protein
VQSSYVRLGVRLVQHWVSHKAVRMMEFVVHLVMRFALEPMAGFLGMYILVILSTAGMELIGVRTGTGADWAFLLAPFVVGTLAGALVINYSSWRPTLTWIILALVTLKEVLVIIRTPDPLQALLSDFGPHCDANECLGRFLFAWPLYSTVSLTLVVAICGRKSAWRGARAPAHADH